MHFNCRFDIDTDIEEGEMEITKLDI